MPGRDQRTCCEAHEIEGIGHLRGFVEVVDAPDEAAVGIPPRAEVLQVDIAHRKHLRSVHRAQTNIGSQFGPSPVGGAQECEGALAHLLVLGGQIAGDEAAAELAAEPDLVVAGGLDNVCHVAVPAPVGHSRSLGRGHSTANHGTAVVLLWT